MPLILLLSSIYLLLLPLSLQSLLLSKSSSSNPSAWIFFICFLLSHQPSRSISSSDSSEPPSIDWNALGHVALLGSFETLSVYDHDYSRPENYLGSNHSTLIAHPIAQPQQQQQQQQSSQQPIIIGTTNPGGSINAICSTPSALFIGGRFDSLNASSSTANFAIYNQSTHAFVNYSSSISGTIHSIYCSNDEDLVWLAGQFVKPAEINQSPPNLIVWSIKLSSFQSIDHLNLPSFDGPIYSLARRATPSGTSLLIGGQFTVPIDSDPSLLSNSHTITSFNPQPDTPNPSPNSISIPTLGSSFAPIPLSKDATWSASPSSSANGYQSPQNIFCPQGPDGPGNSWELNSAFDNGQFTLDLGTSVPVGGIRLGNSFANGGGTAGFHIVSLPNDQILTLTFINPITNQLDNCSDNCTLSRDFNIPYQDYLFPPNTVLSGVQVIITSKFGNTAGLHLLQLLSPGNIAYAVDQLNNPQSGVACRTGIGASPIPSSAKTTGVWDTVKAVTNIPGTVQSVLRATVPPQTSPDNAPTLTWTVSIPQSGNYELALQTPGCSNMGDCPTRTSLAVTVSSASLPPLTTIVDTRTPNDISTTLYNGTLTDATSGEPGAGQLTVTLRLANPTPASSSVSMVANQLVLRATSLRSRIPGGILSHGIYELVLAGKGAFGDGSNINPSGGAKPSLSAVDRLGAYIRPGSTIRSIASDDRTVFLAGDRLSVLNGSSSVTATTLTVPNGGLNGPVHALAVADGILYAGGNFTATIDGAIQGLAGLARWKYGASARVWEPFSPPGSGAGFPVEAFQTFGEMLYVLGRSTDGGARALGIFNPHTSTWLPSNSGVYFGQLTAAEIRADNHPMLYLAGNIDAMGAAETPSGALLSIGSEGNPILSGLNFQMNQTASQLEAARKVPQNPLASLPSNNSPPATASTNSLNSRAIMGARQQQLIQRRQANGVTTNNNLNTSLPFALASVTGATILTGAFLKNQSQLLIGGRFVSANAVSNVGIYDLSASELRPLNNGNKLDGTVLSIKIVNDVAWIGGLFVSPSGKSGLDTYNLTSGTWATETMAGLNGYADTNVSVRTIKSTATSDVVVGGRFQQLGSLSCQSICMWSGPGNQWLNFGNGLKGVVNTIELVGKAQEEIIAAGRFELNQTVPDAAIAKWILNTSNPVWTPIGNQDRIPGTVRMVAVGELEQGETDGLFICGQRLNGDSFLMNWDNNDWTLVPGIDGSSHIEHIAFVPIRNPSTTSETYHGIKNDRLLLVSGWIILSGTSNKFASVLYDGKNWYPYLTGSDFKGQPGVLSRVVTASEGFKSTLRRIHSVIAVIFISMSIALGIVLLGLLIGVLIGYKQRSKENKKAIYPIAGNIGAGLEDEDGEGELPHGGVGGMGGGNARLAVVRRSSSASDIETRKPRRPMSLLATIDAATTAMTERMRNQEKGQRELVDEKMPPHQRLDEEHAIDGGSPVSQKDEIEQSGQMDRYDEIEEENFIAEDDVRRARWSFEPQLPGEIAVAAGESVEVLDRSNQEWWLVKRSDGVEGVVPADWFL